MMEKIYLALLFLLVCAGCTAAQELPKNCIIGVRHREKLTWLNISTLPNNTMRCLENLQKQEAEIKEYREILMDVRKLINKRRRTRGQKSLPETECEMIPEVQECLIPMFCNGKPFWGQFFVRDPATGEVTTKCSYEVERARARLHIMEAEYKLIAHELAEELKMIPTAVSSTASSTVIGRIGSTNGVCPPSTIWGPASTLCPSTPREVTITDTNYLNDVSTSGEGKSSTKADHTGENDVTDKDSFSVALTSTAPHVLSTKDLSTSPTTETTTKDSLSVALTNTAPHVLSTKDLTTSPTTEATTKGSCDITFNGTCYWTHVEDGLNVNFTQAEEICSNKASTPAHFPTERVYNDVVEDLRSKIQSGWSRVLVWTGVTINTNTGNVIHPSGDSYVKWHPDYPGTGSGYKTFTHVALDVNSSPGYTRQGMFNYLPQASLNGAAKRGYGAVCQIVE